MNPQNWTENYIDVNGVNLRYHRTKGNKPPLLLLHGFTDNGLCWTRVAKQLEKNFDIIMPDSRGHGKSFTDQIDYSLESAANDIVELIRHLKLNKPIIMGHSMGGQMATSIAGNHPEILSKLLLEDPAYTFNQKSLKVKIIRTAFKYMIKRGINKTEEQLRKLCLRYNKTWDDEDVNTWVNGQKEYGMNNPLTVFENLSVNVNWHDIFPKITVPSLLIIPSIGFLKLNEAKEIVIEFQNAKIAYIEKAGHSVRRENFEAFMNAVSTFINE